MKIAVLTNLYPPIVRGGAENVAKRIVTELKSRGHDVFVVSTEPYKKWWSFFLRKDSFSAVRVYRVRPFNFYHLLYDYKYPFLLRALWHLIDLYSPTVVGQVKRLFEYEKPDVVLTHNLKGLSLRLPKAIRSLNLPWIHTVHDVQLCIPSGLLIYGKRNWLNHTWLQKGYERSVKRIFGSPDMVISPSYFLYDFYKKRHFFGSSDFKILPNPAPHFKKRLSHQRPEGPLRLLFIGQLEKHKGILFLIQALKKTSIPFELHIAGEGTLTNEITKITFSDQRITYHGFVSTEQIQDLFHVMDVLVVPSLCYENSPTVIYESLQIGIPVMASNIGGVGELVLEGKNGFLFEPCNRQAFLECLEKMYEQREYFWSQSEEIHETVKPYALEHYIDSLEKMMEQVVKRKEEQKIFSHEE